MEKNRATEIVNSALWAAYGDALGFITELADESGVRRRAKMDYVTTTVAWRRLLGGRFGAQVLLPSGCYSDDTQLRLATCRALRGDGSFDVDAFAKVELPVFDAYSLGAGLSTKAAAQSLSNSSINWFSNFYEKGRTRYVTAGGNGVAMRIQPHVWADARIGLSRPSISQILRNCVTTHGHPRALAGALFHALHLSFTVWGREVLKPSAWKDTVGELRSVVDILRSDTELSMVWLPTWEQRTGSAWDKSWADSLRELAEMIEAATRLTSSEGTPLARYRTLVQKLDATNASLSGDALRTAVLSLFLAWELRDEGPQRAIELAVNVLRTDTDSIGTLVGALLGATVQEQPSGEILDRQYIIQEAMRISAIASREKADSFRYPNLLTWKPPRSQLDVVLAQGKKTVVMGLGPINASGEVYRGQKKDEVWQQVVTHFGQTLIVKRRSSLRGVETEQVELFAPPPSPKKREDSPQLPGAKTPVRPPNDVSVDIDKATSELIAAGFPPEEIGRVLLSFAEREGGIEKAVAYAAILVKARRARLLKSRPE